MSLEIIRALAEPLRLRLLHLCKLTSLTVGELAEILIASQPNVSHHIKQLRELGLLNSKRRGARILYACNENADIPAHLMQLWDKLEDLFAEIPEIKEDEKRMYEVLSRRTGESFGADFASWRKLQPDLPYTEMFARLGLPQQGHVIEVGCGEGDFLPVLSENFAYVTGIDKALGHLAQAGIVSQKLPRVQLLQADAAQLPLKSETADAVYFRMSLRFFPDREKSLAEAVRVSKPGARISIIDLPEAQSENTEAFFKDFCATHRQTRFLKFLRLSPVFICIIQKV